jgi:hypothetical protein
MASSDCIYENQETQQKSCEYKINIEIEKVINLIYLRMKIWRKG